MSLVCSLRLLPFAAYVAFSRKTSRAEAAVAVASYSIFPAGALAFGQGRSLIWIAVGLCYYLVLSLCANRISRELATKAVTPGAVFVAFLFAHLIVPGVLTHGFAGGTFLVVGWELVLSTYSYCVETSRNGKGPAPHKEYLFFLFVNPCLVYSARGSPFAHRPWDFAGLRRSAAGALLIFVNWAWLRPATQFLLGLRGDAALSKYALVIVPLYGIVHLVCFYLPHAGLAHMQIGLMRQCGWAVPEAYESPLFASSPMDFWRRWNRYVRVWLETYVFFPTARRIARRTHSPAGQVAAAAATLVASGLFHDAYGFAGHLAIALTFTKIFVAAAIVLALWRLAGRAARPLLRRWHGRVVGLDFATHASARVVTAAILIVAAAAWD